MSDDVDPAVSDALRRLAASAPLPHEDRLQSVVAGARRRQRRVVGGSALSVVALVTATGLGVHSWRDTGSNTPVPGTTFGNPAANSSGSAPASSPASSEPESSAPVSSPATVSPSTSVHATVQPTPPKPATDAEVVPTMTISLSTAHVLLGQQTVATVTVTNKSPYSYPAGQVSIGTRIPADTFDSASPGCILGNGGAECSIVGLQPGQKTVLVFRITLGWAPGSTDDDEIFGGFYFTDSHGQQQDPSRFMATVIVDNGTASDAPPTSGPPSSPIGSPPASGAPTSGAPTSAAPSSSPSASPTASASPSETPSVTPS